MDHVQANKHAITHRVPSTLYALRVSRGRQVGLFLIATGLLALVGLVTQIVPTTTPVNLLLWLVFGGVAAWGGALFRDALQPERLLYHEILEACSRFTRDTTDPELLLDQVSHTLHTLLRTHSLTLWRHDDADSAIKLLRAEGTPLPLDLAELPLDLDPTQICSSWLVLNLPDSALKQGLQAAGIQLVAPLRLGDTLVGFWGLGEPQAGLRFNPKLRDWLDLLAGQIALIVQNALLLIDLNDTTQRLYLAYRRTTDVQEAERRNLATELHDDILGRLTTMALTLSQSQKQLAANFGQGVSRSLDEYRRPERSGNAFPFSPPQLDAVRERLQHLEIEAQNINRRLREITQGLHPSVLADLGLISAMRAYIDSLARQPLPETPLKIISLTAQGFEQQQFGSQKLERDLYYITRQALDNAIKHAQAGQIFIHLRWDKEIIGVTVRDTGRGMPGTPERLMGQDGHLGLLSMRERALAWQGNISFHTSPEQGTTIRARLPIDQPSRAPAHLQAYTQYLSS